MAGEPPPVIEAPAGYVLGPCIGGRAAVTRVFAGVDAMERPVALKTLDPLARADALARARFAAEQRCHGHASGAAHVIPMVDATLDDWLITAWAHGGTLDEAPPQSHEAVSAIVTDLLRACVALTARGIVHRDIKPSNVLRDRGTVWLTDFGIAAMHTSTGGWRALPEPWVETEIGTPGWVAPELQCADPAQAIHPANDVYSVARIWEWLRETARVTQGHEPDACAALRAQMLSSDPGARPSASDALTTLCG
jgi:eukaryotic-like serine/threonine-protein kinase